MSRIKTLKKLNEIFKLGYRPSRHFQSYKHKLPSGSPIGHLTNCLEHACFNLTNQQIIQQNFTYDDKFVFQNFIDLNKSLQEVTEDMLNFVESTGLIVSKDKKRINKRNEWRIAVYYRADYQLDDFHFLLQEKSGIWTSKVGSTNIVNTYLTLPNVVQRDYDIFGVYTIKNPFIKDKEKTL